MNRHVLSNNGFTLVEVLMTVGILVLAASCSYDFLRSSLTRFRFMQKENMSSRDASVAFALLSRDIRSAYLTNDDVLTRFVGHHVSNGDRLQFVRMGGSPDREPVKESISYDIEADGGCEGGFYLRRNYGVDFSNLNHATDICSRIKNFDVTYFDGARWHDEWGWDIAQQKPFDGIRGLPLLVSVHIRFENDQNQFTDETRIIPVMTTLLNWRSNG